MIEENIDFELLWVSVYTFQCRRLKRFRHHQIIFVGDAAHQVSPFGARGANGGVQDVNNLIWKLKLVIENKAAEDLLESYNHERILAADENILHSTKSTEFVTPKTESSKLLRDAVLSLSKNVQGIRPFINSGRLSTSSIYKNSPLNSPDQDEFGGNAHIGGPCIDAPILYNGKKSWFLKVLGGKFCGAYFTEKSKNLDRPTISQFNILVAGIIPFKMIIVTQNLLFKQKTIDYPVIIDYEKELNNRYDAIPGTFYLVRPDQHIAARWKKFNLDWVQQSLRKSIGYPIKKINTVKKTYKSVDHLLDIPNLKNPDDIYQNLIESQSNFDDNELKIFYARLILLLMNQIGNEQILKQAINIAQKGMMHKNKIN